MQLTKQWAATLDDYVIDLAWSADGTQLAAASGAGPVTVFTAAEGAVAHELPGHADGTNVIAAHPSQSLLATGGQDGAVKLWDLATGQHTATAELGSNWVDHLAWRPAGETTLAAGVGRVLTLLNPDGSTRHTFAAAPKTLCALAWQPAGGCLAAAYFGGVVLWDAEDFVAQQEYAYANGIQALVWSPDNRWLVSGNQDPSVHLWRPTDNEEFHMSGYETKVKELAFDHRSRWLATGGGREGCIWDCTGNGPEGRMPTMVPHEARICAVAFQNRHGLLATAAADGVVRLWAPDRNSPNLANIKLPAAATKFAWSPDDTHLAIGSEQGIVYVLKVIN